ncbi:glycosyltransferase involved in cell wall biosynthesis [Kribbella rubisoli]|uniref:Glycosyltransferase involved in cell wall biosynthesis n=1 Tax=Kribbella rubisoli TaxID=3075929 RepID=A0A4Q7X9V9_9ACTN|nr:glycosyltransferase [Kribbella rubisoli]RZU19937.1 glycosyltransferase involved in cell wall biosynthesis [Kribbella rubisoli]
MTIADDTFVPSTPSRRLVIVVRADPVICGHSGEARCLAEVALTRGFDDVRIVTWPQDALEAAGLPLKPLDRVLPYSPGITVERPSPVGDYRVPDGRYLSGLIGRLIELFGDGVPTVAMSLYLSPHTIAVQEAVQVARRIGPAQVVTVAEAVGSDITNVVRECVATGRFGAAAHILSVYLAADHCVAVSEYTKDLIVASAATLDDMHGTTFAQQCRERIAISYPAVDSWTYLSLTDDGIAEALTRRGLSRDGYVLFLSRIASAKGVDDLIDAYAGSRSAERVPLVLAGRGPHEAAVVARIAAAGLGGRVRVLTDVDDAEKPALMAGSAAFVLPTREQPEFVETFGIALVEKALAGGGPIITCATGGVPEAVGDTALLVPQHDPDTLRAVLDEVVCDWTREQRAGAERRARAYALQFDRVAVFDRLFARAEAPAVA